MPTVDGVVTAPDAYGTIQGNGGATDFMAGGSGNDRLQGHADFNGYYGGAGNDTFVIANKFAVSTGTEASLVYADQAAYVSDFTGAGGRMAGDNDFLAFTGFGAGSTLSLTHTGTSGTAGAVLYYYAITDGVTGEVTNILINSLNGQQLGAGDYQFYA